MPPSSALARRISDYNNPNSPGSGFRARRIAPLLEMIAAAHARHGAVRLADIGGTATYWNIVPRQFLLDHNVRISLINLPGREQHAADDLFQFVAADACDLAEFTDGTFHIAHSNSVLEHVGDWGRMTAFAREARRVAGAYFVQTPNYWFPLEPHAMTPFFHWLPKPLRVALVQRRALGHWRRAASVAEAVAIVESARLVDRKMLAALFPDAEIHIERVLLLAKSFVALRRAGP